MKRLNTIKIYLLVTLTWGVFILPGCGGSWDKPGTADTTLAAHTVTAVAPFNNAQGVPTNTKIFTAAFSKAMDSSTLTPTSFTLAHGDSAVAVAGGVVTYISPGDVATLTLPTADLLPNTLYTATITTAVRDEAGNALANDFIWVFTTGDTQDTTPPTVIATSVYGITGDTSDATGLPVNRSSTAIFSEPMNALSITAFSTFTVVNNLGVNVTGTVTYAVGSQTATFKPTFNLEPLTLYTSTITTGAEDLAGNTLVSDYVWSWTTGDGEDSIRPLVLSTLPMDEAINVTLNQNISVEFNEDMDSNTITNLTFTLAEAVEPVSGLVSYNLITERWTFAPMEDLAPNTTYTVTITTGATDLAGNELEGNQLPPPPEASNYVWTFTTGSQLLQQAVPLGSASNFVILASAGITNIPLSTITGDVGLTPDSGSNISGFADPLTCPEVTGTIYAVDATGPDCAMIAPVLLLEAKDDAEIAFLDARAAVRGTPAAISGDLNGLTLYPGLYESLTSLEISPGGILYLDAQGDVNAVFIIRSETSITTESMSQVILTNGAKANNVYWTAGSSVTLGTNSTMKGTLIAGTGIALLTSANLEGRALNQGAAAEAVTLDQAVITLPLP